MTNTTYFVSEMGLYLNAEETKAFLEGYYKALFGNAKTNTITFAEFCEAAFNGSVPFVKLDALRAFSSGELESFRKMTVELAYDARNKSKYICVLNRMADMLFEPQLTFAEMRC